MFFVFVLPPTILSIVAVVAQHGSPKVFKNEYADVRKDWVSGGPKMHITIWSLISPFIWWLAKWKEYDRLILRWPTYMYDFAL
jgi:hypothetical protein